MADTSINPNTTQAQSTTPPVKKAIFGGNQEAFDNLEKFEQLTNPLDSDEEIDFEFDEFLDQEKEQENNDLMTDDSDEYSFPQASLTEETPTPQEADEFVLPSEEVAISTPAENVFEAAIQAPQAQSSLPAEEEGFHMPFDAPSEAPNLQENQPTPQNTENTEENQKTSKDEVNVKISFEDKAENSEINTAPETPEIKVEADMEAESTQEADFSTFSTSSETEQKLPPSPLSQANQELAQEEITAPVSDIAEATEATEQKTAEEPTEASEIPSELAAHQQLEAEPEVEQSKFMTKFSKLMQMTQQIFALHKSLDQEINEIEILGSNTQKSMVRYLVNEVPRTDGAMLQIKKVEKEYSDNSESEHLLHLFPEKDNKNLMIIVDEFPLYEEEKDFSEPIKAAIVNDKLNKFDLLLSEQLKPLEAELSEKKAQAEKEKAFRSIFRDF